MTARQDYLSLAAMLDAAATASDQDDAGDEASDIARTSCRIPRAVLHEVGALAQANRMSVNLVINLLLDSYLIGLGRPGYAELAADYVSRNKAETAKEAASPA